MIKFNLKKVMKQKNLNISQLNEMTGISRNSLSLLINGKSQGIQFETMEKITKALNVEIDSLFKNTFDYVSINIKGKKRIKGFFPSLSNKTQRDRLDKNIEVINENDYSHNSFSVLDCTYMEDSIEKREYLPYRIFIDVTGSNKIFIDMNLEKSLLSNEFRRVLNVEFDEIGIRSIVNYYFIDKILQIEQSLLQQHFKNHSFTIHKVVISSYLEGLEISPWMFKRTTVNLTKDYKPEIDNEIKETLDLLNEKSNYLYEYNNKITINNLIK